MKRILILIGFVLLIVFLNAQTNINNTSILASGQWVRIGVTQAGIYKIEGSQLSALGLPATPFPTNSLRVFGKSGGMLNEKLDSTSANSLVEIPLETGSNFALFYAPGSP